MKITAISPQVKNKNRVNVSVDGRYRLSLDIYQLVDLGVKVGREYDETELATLEQESQFGKIYARALDYCLVRSRSAREIRDYLYRKTRPTRDKTGELKAGVSSEITVRVLERLTEKGYIDDQKFTRYWIDNRSLNKGISRRKLIVELRAKGIDNLIIEQTLNDSKRDDNEELQKIIAKKRTRYPDNRKLMAYLARLGFEYDDIKQSLSDNECL